MRPHPDRKLYLDDHGILTPFQARYEVQKSYAKVRAAAAKS